MSEFDTGGFSAIDRFFGEDAKNKNATSGKESSKIAHHHIPKVNKRQGVGSVVPVKEAPTDLTKKLLKVGRKRGRTEEEDDDGDDKDAGKEVHDEDEEAGRTSIVSRETAPRAEVEVETKLKKKPGKKERKKRQEEEQASEVVKEDQKGNDSQVGEDTKEIMIADDEPSPTGEIVPKKHKRRKIRSKQKNIRKDNRETKPDHLVVGRKRYQGRPLTAETRAKLNLPAPKVRTPHMMEAPDGDDDIMAEGIGLAIDDLLEDSGKRVEETSHETVKKKANKKIKKAKYKNLKV
mmetsp:Transcript_2917/g.8301  ORF Transcript_2917/g.8301 Transcript_2917/m.8301 type:complete len:291 (-) Transcript_2917:46-918(-)